MPEGTKIAVPAKKGLASSLLKIFVSAALVILLLAKTQWESAAELLKSADQRWVFVGFAFAALTPLLTALRWKQCCAAMGMVLPLPLLVKGTYSSQFVGQFLPAGVGVDAARVGLLWQEGIPPSRSLGAIVLDRLTGVAGIFALAMIGLPYLPGTLPIGTVGAVGGSILITCLFGAGLLFLDRLPWQTGWSNRLRRFAGFMAKFRGALSSGKIVGAFGYSILIHLLTVSSILVIARGFGHALQFWPFLTVSSIAVFLSLLPVSFSGWGVRESALLIGFSALNVPRDSALLISIVYGVVLAVVSLPGCVVIKYSLPKMTTEPGEAHVDAVQRDDKPAQVQR